MFSARMVQNGTYIDPLRRVLWNISKTSMIVLPVLLSDRVLFGITLTLDNK